MRRSDLTCIPGQETLDSLKSICGNVHITKGDCDEASSAPEDEVLAIGDLKVGLCHGHQVRLLQHLYTYCRLSACGIYHHCMACAA
jgi:predicted phosphodiesterase